MNKKIEELTKKLSDLGRRYDQSHLDLLEQILEIEPENYACLMEKATALWYMEREEEALSTYDKIIEITGHDFAAYNRKGEMLSALGRKKEAEFCFHKASNPDEG